MSVVKSVPKQNKSIIDNFRDHCESQSIIIIESTKITNNLKYIVIVDLVAN